MVLQCKILPCLLAGSGTLREYLRAEARQGGTTAATQAFLHGPHGQKRTAEPAATEVAQQQPAAKCARTASEGQGGLEQQAHCGVVAQQPAEAALAPGCGLRPVTVERLSRHFEVRRLWFKLAALEGVMREVLRQISW